MTTHLRAVTPPRATCTACHQPMVWLGWDTHPCCDPVVGWPPSGGIRAPDQATPDPEQRPLWSVK